MINYCFKIDVKGEKTKYSDLVFTSGDIRAERLTFTFTDKGKPFNTENCFLSVKARRSDGIIITDMGGRDAEGRLYYDIKNSMTEKEGELSFEIALCDENGSFVTVCELFAYVRKGYGEADLKAIDTTPVLSSLLSQGAKIELCAKGAQESAKEAQESARKAESSAKEMKQTMDDYSENFKRYPYRAVDSASLFHLLDLYPNTVTLVHGEAIESGEFMFNFTWDDGSENITQEIVLILDLTDFETVPSVILGGNSIRWINGEPPEIEAGKVYIFSFLLANQEELYKRYWLAIGGEFY